MTIILFIVIGFEPDETHFWRIINCVSKYSGWILSNTEEACQYDG